jgi:two-component system cell cycle response regulator
MEAQPFNLLLVDDDATTARLVRSLLGKLKPVRYALEWRSTAQDGLEELRARPWDACLLDYRIGDQTGLDVLRAAMEAGVSTPIILFTAGAGPDVDVECMRAGAADYLLKSELSASLLQRTIRYAVERTRLLNEVRALARHDHLTGLLSRREFDRLLKEELVRCQRYGHRVALALIDIDYFKQINDRYGHATGDVALRWVSSLLLSSVRDTDRAARYGGDELALLLPETDATGAWVLAERVRWRIESGAVPMGEGTDADRIKLSLSIGIVSQEGQQVSDDIVSRADAALYEAKRLGRNQVVCAA